MKTVSRMNSLGLDAVAALRTTRRKHRVEEMEWFEALYRVYLAAIVIGGTILFLSGLIKDTELTPAELTMVSQRGPHVLQLRSSSVFVVATMVGHLLLKKLKCATCSLHLFHMRWCCVDPPFSVYVPLRFLEQQQVPLLANLPLVVYRAHSPHGRSMAQCLVCVPDSLL